MRWDARGLRYLFPVGLMVWSFFTDQPLQAALRAIAFIATLGITVLLRRRDPGWGRSRSAAPNRSASPDD